MSTTFDIFHGYPIGTETSWIESVEGLAFARTRMEQIATEKPGPYFLFSADNSRVVATVDTTVWTCQKSRA